MLMKIIYILYQKQEMVLLYQEVMIILLKYGKIKNYNNYLIFEVKYLIILMDLLNIIKFKNIY